MRRLPSCLCPFLPPILDARASLLTLVLLLRPSHTGGILRRLVVVPVVALGTTAAFYPSAASYVSAPRNTAPPILSAFRQPHANAFSLQQVAETGLAHGSSQLTLDNLQRAAGKIGSLFDKVCYGLGARCTCCRPCPAASSVQT